ncbi:MAG: CPBP family intramembrane metalloprotease [Bacteroidaceae bacterium]|nr:CPBP family intramembrane metalloprotease [Bacteroidaceae bacterium]
MKAIKKPILAILVFCLMQILAPIIVQVIARLTGEIPSSPNDASNLIEHTYQLALALIISGMLTVVILYYMNMIKRKGLVSRFRSVDWEHAPLAITAAIMGIIVLDLLSEYVNAPDLMQPVFMRLAENKLGVLALVFVAPIVEELVFREGVLGYLRRHEIGTWTAIISSSLAFALLHFNPAQIPFAFVMGIMLGYIYVKTSSIIITSIIHIINNLLATLEMRYFDGSIQLHEILGSPLMNIFYILVCTFMCFLFMREFKRKYHRKHIHAGNHSSHPNKPKRV